MAAQTLVPILYARDARHSAQWYERLGFTVTGEHRFAPDLPLYLFLRWGELQVHLSEHQGDARPGTLLYLWVPALDPIAQGFGATVEDLPWARQVEIADPDGNRWRIGEEF
ncbi:MAG TPA: bleomycin resistance family protein [Cyanobacteria bacterium UBA8156]|jgi:catechol 2,3-dioxygenase-like lactoylglutathione lyase family enzyme|nr:bleomycin resistance family protein [Cyanobacteria bacterium UBA8156]